MVAASDRVHRATRSSDSRPRVFRAGTPAAGPATVHSCFRSALNIVTADGLLTIASEAVGGLPNGIVADLGPDFRSLGITPGMVAEGDAGQVQIPEAGVAIDARTAVSWSPRLRRMSDGGRGMAVRWRARSARTRSIALDRATPGGLAGLLEASPARAGTDPFDVTERARPSLLGLAGALAADDLTAAAIWARELIGLGPGLTPSGDDLLVGLEAALHGLADRRAGFLAAALADVDDRTTVVAATFLRRAARGEFAERIHRLLAALLGPDAAAIPGAIEQAVAWGATSGTDCLVGVLFGLDVATTPARRSDA